MIVKLCWILGDDSVLIWSALHWLCSSIILGGFKTHSSYPSTRQLSGSKTELKSQGSAYELVNKN